MQRLILLSLAATLAAQDPAPTEPRGQGEPARPAQPPRSSLAELAYRKLLGQYDKDDDGRITKAEYPRGEQAFANLDRNQDGFVTRADFDLRIAPGSQRARGRSRQGAGARARPQPPRVGELAPDFELPLLGMKDTTVKLSDLRGDRPVALIFGSYT